MMNIYNSIILFPNPRFPWAVAIGYRRVIRLIVIRLYHKKNNCIEILYQILADEEDSQSKYLQKYLLLRQTRQIFLQLHPS